MRKHFTMIIFGGTGDLSQKKLLPTLYFLFSEGDFSDDFSIVGIGTTKYTNEEYAEMVKGAIKKNLPEKFDENKCTNFLRHVTYRSGDLRQEDIYKELCTHINGTYASKKNEPNVIYYLATIPDLVGPIVEHLNAKQLCVEKINSKIIVEKPFGNDKASAAKLNDLILKSFTEKQIYRIDHYLGKDTVQNLTFFRFGNSIFEPLWNRNYVDHVQITVAEDIGIEKRGPFYEQAGVIRDIIQNHMLQLIALVGMEPPANLASDAVRDEKWTLLKAIRPMDDENIRKFTVLGQYGPGKINGEPVCGYREEERVDKRSVVPTYFAGKFFIDNWRWSEVPFYVRAGKRMAGRASEVRVQFRQPPLKLFEKRASALPNELILNIQPSEEIDLSINVKTPGIEGYLKSTMLKFNYEKEFNTKQYPPYARLLIDCIMGDTMLFARQDAIETMWSIVDPIINFWDKTPRPDFPNYDAGTWGPKEADALMERDGRKWHEL